MASPDLTDFASTSSEEAHTPEESVIPQIPIPSYTAEELEKLVHFIREMTILYGLNNDDWNSDVLDTIREWFLHVNEIMLTVYYDGNKLSASMSFPQNAVSDLTYFLREPMKEFTVDGFHDEVMFGNIHGDVDGSLLSILESVFSPMFFQYGEWKENVRAHLVTSCNKFLSFLNGLHYKISGITILYVPNTVKNLEPEAVRFDREFMKSLENIAINWGSQIRLCLQDKQHLVPYELLCPNDEYEFWIYRKDVLTAIGTQIKSNDIKNIFLVLKKTQSVYIKQLTQLVKECQDAIEEAKSNIKYLKLFVDPCKEIDAANSPAEIASKLPKIIHIFRYIWLKSAYYNTSEHISGLFRSLTNQIIQFCCKHIQIDKVLNGNPRFGIKMCDMAINCCLSYKNMYEIISKQHDERNPEIGWKLDTAMIFNHLNAFIERLYDLIDISESMIVFGRIDETELLKKPKFGGVYGVDYENTCSEVENKFKDAVEKLKSDSKDLLLDVHNSQWYNDVIKYRLTIKELEETITRLMSNVFITIGNLEEGLEALIALLHYSYRRKLRDIYISKVIVVWEMFIAEIDSTNKRIVEKANVRTSLMPKYASRAFMLKTNLERITQLKDRLVNAEWLPLVPQQSVALSSFKKMEEDFNKNIKKSFNDWINSLEPELTYKLNRTLIIRSKTHEGLIECNIDRTLLEICEEARFFTILDYQISAHVAAIYSKYDTLRNTFDNVITVTLDYNRIIQALSLEERKLFKAVIAACDKKIRPGMTTLTWGGELSDEYIADCVKHTSELQQFIDIYKRANSRIASICEHICDIPIFKASITEAVELSKLVDILQLFRNDATRRILRQIQSIAELIVAVYRGFEPYIQDMTEEWLLYIRRCDKMIEAAILTSAKSSIVGIYEILHGDEVMDPNPIVTIDVNLLDNEIVFEPPFKEISDVFKSILTSIAKALEKIPRLWERFELPEDDLCKPYRDMVYEVPDCQINQDKIDEEIHHNMNMLDSYLDKWLPFRSLWELDKDLFMKQYDGVETSAEAFDSHMERYTELVNQIVMMDRVNQVYFVLVNSDKLKYEVLGHIENWQLRHMDLLSEIAEEKITHIYQYVENNSKTILTVPRNINEMKDSVKLYQQLIEEYPDMMDTFPSVIQYFKIMKKYEVHIEPELQEHVNNLDERWKEYFKALSEAGEMIGIAKDNFKLATLKKAEKFKNSVRMLLEDFKQNAPTSADITSVDALQYLNKKLEKYNKMVRKEIQLIEDCNVFVIPLTRNRKLMEWSEEIEVYFEIWTAISEWDKLLKQNSVENVWKLNLEEIEEKVTEMYRKMNRLYKKYRDREVEALEATKDKVDNFRRTIPLLNALKNPQMRPRHWNKIKELVKSEFNEKAKSFNVELIMELNFQVFSDEIQDISLSATMELQVETGLKTIEDAWKTMAFEMAPYTDQIYRIKNVDECSQLLEDHLVMISTMKSTRYVEPFIRKADYWEKTLSYISETLDNALSIQRQWLYLENIFYSEDIKRQLPEEYRKFNEITSLWEMITSNMNKYDTALKATHFKPPPFLLSKLLYMDKIFESIHRSLEVYLEIKRQIFPRFYFVSTDDLLEILGNAKKPDAVQIHLKKLFDNLYSLELRKIQLRKSTAFVALGMYSADGEYVDFLHSVRITKSSEHWLQSIDDAMIETLKDTLVSTRASLKTMLRERDRWLDMWPGQLCITCSQLQWTFECTRSLIFCKMIDEKRPLKKLKSKQLRLLQRFSQMSRSNLPQLLRLKVNGLITIEIHGRDVIDRMYKLNCKDVTHFEWFSQLRFYWERSKNICVVRQTNTEHKYGYEYGGNSGRLAITPLTDRCYITLTTALHLYRGGNPKGPAGTGKTETTKDLGKNLAIWVVVTNCSEGLDYKSIGRNFSGLAQAGVWGCFDEFNRINIEVLSVVAQQILSILQALAQHLTLFQFEGQMIKLRPTVGIFITMNPGYAGRTELPDNLKTMFRPIAMIVPDTAIIAENILFSFGFRATKSLARKVFILYELAKQQLSRQFHYDFGLRSMAALLRYAGKQLRELQEATEEQVVYLAMKDMNVARLTANDLPLFTGIMADIFPGVTVPVVDYKDFKTAIEDDLKAANKKPISIAVNKVIELYETKNSRHAVMIVGDTNSAKSTTWKTLQGAYDRMKAKRIPGWVDVIVYPINPKALTTAELYGEYNLSTGEWFDGVISKTMRIICNETTPTQKWMLFDGPVDAVWIENMNSVMDDNKLLTLVNSERIAMPPQVSLLFEVGDLAVASPATVSRCGMVYNDYSDWGWRPYVNCWYTTQKYEPFVTLLDEYFEVFVDRTLDFKRLKCTELVKTHELNSVMSVCNLLTTFATKQNGISPNVSQENLETMTKLWFLFCLIWGICGTVNEEGRIKFDAFIRELESVFPLKNTIFDYYVDPETKSFLPWESKLVADWMYDESLPFYKIIVPTSDTVKYSYLVTSQLVAGVPVLLVGNVGTGKTSIATSVTDGIDKDKYIVLPMNISAQTTATGLQESIESKVEKRTRTTYAPPGGKTMVCFMDDFNMPAKDTYGSQPPLELIRQWIDYKFWYNRKTQARVYIVNTHILAAMGPPGGGRQVISSRTLSRFYVINMTFPTPDTLTNIFGTILNQKIANFTTDVKQACRYITAATINLYESISAKMLPTPAKIHYIFNLRDISKVFQGLLRSDLRYHTTKPVFLRLWMHECYRIFSDRLVDNTDRNWFEEEVNEMLVKYFETSFVALCPSKNPPIFGDYMSGEGYYEDITDLDDLKAFMIYQLKDYNNTPGVMMMDLVLFQEAIEHISRIVRVISQQRCHMLNIGIGGSGRQVYARLAAYICEFEIFTIEVTKKYRTPEFREDLKILYKQTGVKNKKTCFIFKGEQVVEHSFLEIINNMLSTCEINLFKSEEFEEFKSDLEQQAKKQGVALSSEAIYQFFMSQVRNNLHVVLCMSPIGDNFRTYVRQYPALINATSINMCQEWPRTALLEVAQKFLSACHLCMMPPTLMHERRQSIDNVEDKLKGDVASMFSLIHTTVIDMSNLMFLQMKRHNYVTHINYLDLVKGYERMLETKRQEIITYTTRLQNGLLKIAETQDKIALMQEELQINQIKVEELSQECSTFLTEIGLQAKAIDEKKAQVTEESKVIAKEEVECKALAAQAAKELEEVLPALENAAKALEALSKRDISEVKSYGRPPVKVEKVMEAIIILGRKPTWEESKKALGEANFLNDLRAYDKDHVSDNILKKISLYTRDPELDPEKVGTVSLACKSLMIWILAIENYAKVYRVVAPKKEKLDEALSSLSEKQNMLKENENNIIDLNEKLAILQKDYETKTKEEETLLHRAEKLRLQLERALFLIDSLGGEQQRWRETIGVYEEKFLRLPGDCLISTAFISYMGPFDSTYRDELRETWWTELTFLQIPCSDDLEVVQFLVPQVTIREWNIQGLPLGNFSTENGILITMGSRFPLVIDPQLQAHDWIRSLERDRLDVIDFELPDYMKILEKALSGGRAVLLQNVLDQLDPGIIPILRKQIITQEKRKYIKFNDKLVEYNEEFRLYITTKLSNPHYYPEITSKTVLINFSVKEVGLEAQLLGIIVRKEKPFLEEQKDNLIVTIAKNRKILIDLDSEILRLLNETKGSLLDSEDLFHTLQKSREVSATVKESLTVAELTELEIDSARLGYQPAAHRASLLFFVLMDMAKIDPMYQFSLKSYVLLFNQSLNKSNFSYDVEQRIKNINEYHTYAFYKNTCRVLFEKHKLLFSMHMCAKILESGGKLVQHEYEFLIKGGVVLDRQIQPPNPASAWISDNSWDNLTELDKLPGFRGLVASIAQNQKDWLEWYKTPKPEEETLVGEWRDILNDTQKYLIVRCLRLDRMIACVSTFIANSLGSKYTEPPVLNLKAIFEDSTSQTPLIFILSPGVDPVSSLYSFAIQSKMENKFFSLSLGQGQAPAATKLLKDGVRDGNWIFLANCHLSLSWMPKLDKIIETIQNSKVHRRFRLWLSSNPHPEFPISILQAGVKISTEPPKGIKANMKRLYSILTEEQFERSQYPLKYKRLLFALCFFHTLLIERRKFGQLGWNVIYSFNDSDFEVSEIILNMYLNEYADTPWGALKFLIAGINYGGHVTDDWDRRLLLTYIEQFFIDEIFTSARFHLSTLSTYFVPREGDLRSYIDYINLLPTIDRPEAFGQHTNADIASLLTESRYMFETLISIKVQVAVTEGESKEEKVLALAKEMQSKISEPMPYEEIARNIGPDKEPLSVVLLQEIERYNMLTKCIKTSLIDVQKGVKGLVVMTSEMEDIFNAIYEGRVPHSWRFMYNSLKPLPSWVRDFVARIEYFRKWSETLQPPSLFWLSAYTFPTGFLTAVLQTTSRANNVPIDELSWDFIVYVEDELAVERLTDVTGIRVRGIFLEGAGWERKNRCLQEPKSMELVTPMPVILFKPVENAKKRTRGIYECPCYYFPERAGSFVIAVGLKSGEEKAAFWVKRGTALLLSLAD